MRVVYTNSGQLPVLETLISNERNCVHTALLHDLASAQLSLQSGLILPML